MTNKGVVLVNLGTPKAAKAGAVKAFLAEFLADPRVVELPRWVWWPLLHGFVLPRRPAVMAKKYASIWRGDQSPLEYYSRAQLASLQANIPQVQVTYAARYGGPSLDEGLDTLCAAGCTQVLVLPLYPQYSSSTNGSVGGVLGRWMARRRSAPSVRWLRDYHDHPAYIEALAASLRRHWKQQPPAARLLLSFHGLPRVSVDQGDPYYFQCHRTANLLRQRLQLAPQRVMVSFQSRFGAQPWLRPYTVDTVRQLAAEHIASVDVYCPGFSVDCLETLEEIDVEVRQSYLAAGGHDFRYIPCLNDSAENSAFLTTLVREQLATVDEGGLTMDHPIPTCAIESSH